MKRELFLGVGIVLLVVALLSIPVGAFAYVGAIETGTQGLGNMAPTPNKGDLVDTETIVQELRKLGFSQAEVARVVDALTLKTDVMPKDYIDPVTLIVRKLQSLGMSDSRIVQALGPLGMGWDPSTGAKWRGRVPTPEEERALRKWTPPSAPGSSISATFKREAGMYTNGMWYGIKDEMKPGSLAIQASQTTDHCATSHLSDLTAGVDVGVYRFLDNPAWQFFTWDSDDGRGHLFHGTTDASTFSEYYIVCSDWQAGYTAFINRNWVRSHSTPWHGYVYLVKEAWSNSGIFTDDTYSAWFQKPRLYSAPDGLGETRWDNTINDQTYENPPMHMTRSLQQWPEGTMWTELIWVANP